MSIKIGDRVRVVKNGPYDGDKNLGNVGVLTAIDVFDESMPYSVWFGSGPRPTNQGWFQMEGDWWCAEVEPVDPVLVPIVDRAYIERLGLGIQETHELLELYEAYVALK